MATPTLSMQIAGERGRAEAIKRRRSEAAKKAWRTRRRLVKLSPTMRAVLGFLASYADAYISVGYLGTDRTSVRACRLNDDGSSAGCLHPPRVSWSTYLALERRGCLEFVRRRETGGIMGELPDGSRGRVLPSCDYDYRITDKGRRVLCVSREQDEDVPNIFDEDDGK